MSRPLTEEQIHRFHQDGVLVIKDFYAAQDVLNVQKAIYDVIGQVMLKHEVADTRSPFNAATFDEGYSDLIAINRAWGGEIYDAVKQIPAFFRLVSHPEHEKLFTALRPESIPGIAGVGYGIRIDNPHEDKFRAMWHQEYPAQLRSKDGLVFWSPLVQVTEDLGPVSFCANSHKLGALPVFDSTDKNTGRTGAYNLKLVNEDHIIGQYQVIAPLTKPTDLVIVDFMTVHASGFNRSNRPRWSMQFRYFNFADPAGRAHGWQGSFAQGTDFRIIHPELFQSNGIHDDL